jgi:ATP-dependent Clp protease ATP-binding subunit ClpX
MDITYENKQLPAVFKQDIKSISVENIPTPQELRRFLHQYVIGQNMAKTYIAGTVALHYRRAADMLAGNREKFSKANVLLIGPTGVGKTELLRTLRRCLSKSLGQIPMTTKSATKITEAGYVGDDAESVIEALFYKALKAVNPKNSKLTPELIEKSVQLTQLGIVHIDEIDKISDDGSGAGGSVSRKGAQNALLTMMEGDIVTVKLSTGVPGQSIPVDIDTSTILFIGSGAFMGASKGSKSIYELSESRRGGKASSTGAGFLAQFDDAENYAQGTVDDIEPEDVVNYGLGHEFVGRLTNIVTLSRLSIHALARIITEPKAAILPEYIEDMMKFYNISIMLSQDVISTGDDDAKEHNGALHAIATKADLRKTGARAIQSVINRVTFFITNFPEKLNGKHILITHEGVNDPDKLKVFDDPNGDDFEYIGDILAPTLAKIGEKDDIDNGLKPTKTEKDLSEPEVKETADPDDDKS